MSHLTYTDPDVEQIENLFNAVYGLRSETDPETESCRISLERIMVKKLMDFPVGNGTFKAGIISLNPENGTVIKEISPKRWWDNKTIYLQEPVKIHESLSSRKDGEPEKETKDREYTDIAKIIFKKGDWETYRNPLIMLQVRDGMKKRTLTAQTTIAFGKQLDNIIKAMEFQKTTLSDHSKVPEQAVISIMDTCYDTIEKVNEQCIFGDDAFYDDTRKSLTRKFMMSDMVGGMMTFHYIPEKDLNEMITSIRKCSEKEMKEIYNFTTGNKKKSISFSLSMPLLNDESRNQMIGDFIQKYSTTKDVASNSLTDIPPAAYGNTPVAIHRIANETEKAMESLDAKYREYTEMLNVNWMVKCRISKAFMTKMVSDINTGLLACEEPYLKQLMLRNGMSTDTAYDQDTLWYDVLMNTWDIRRTDNQEIIETDMKVNRIMTEVLRKYFKEPKTADTGSED